MTKRLLCLVFLLPCVFVYAGAGSLVGRTFELRQPLFLYYSTVLDSYVLEPPGFSTRVPPSIAQFEQHGESWRIHDNRQLSRDRRVVPNELMEKIPIGAHVSVIGMQRKPAAMFEVWAASGQIDDPRFGGITVRLAGLLWDTTTDNPRIDTVYLIPVTDDK